MTEKVELPELKKCPHCGWNADLEWEDEEVWIECGICHSKGPAYSRGIARDSDTNMKAVAKAIEGWNRRDEGKKALTEERKKEIAEKLVEKLSFAEGC